MYQFHPSNSFIRLVTIFATLPALLGSFLIASFLQVTYVPVVYDFKITKATYQSLGDRHLAISGSFSKITDQCKYLNQIMMIQYQEGRWFRTRWMPTKVDQPDNVDTSRPSGLNNFGPWLIYLDKLPSNPTDVRLVVRHTCFGFFPATTDISYTIGPVL